MNGNMKSDLNKGISSISYDKLDHPVQMQYSDGSVIDYVYSADGRKLMTTYISPVDNLKKSQVQTLHFSSTGFLSQTPELSVNVLSENLKSPVSVVTTLSPIAHNVVERDATLIDNISITEYLGNFIFENGKLTKILMDDGYIEIPSKSDVFLWNNSSSADGGPLFHYFIKDHLGSNRVVLSENGSVEQINHYYPYGGLIGDISTNPETQKYKYNGKEYDTMYGLNTCDYGARQYDPARITWDRMDPLCEKYYHINPYVYCAGNPVNYIDLHGDSITMDDQSIMAIYNGLKKGHNITMKFNNGVLDPSSIEEQVKSSSDTFLQDLYEIATNKQMVELAVTSTNDYYMNGEETVENWNSVKDYDIQKDENLSEIQRQELMRFMPSGLTYMGNAGQTLYPKNSNELKRSLNNNIRININNLTNINHRSCAIAHEFGHVVLYLRHLPHSHPIADKFIYGRQWNVMQRLGYDYY